MLMQRAGGPHPSGMPPIDGKPTVEEISTAKMVILNTIGEKKSEKRIKANQLCADGLIDKEQGLGYLLCDRFRAVPPSPEGARDIGK